MQIGDHVRYVGRATTLRSGETVDVDGTFVVTAFDGPEVELEDARVGEVIDAADRVLHTYYALRSDVEAAADEDEGVEGHGG